MSNAIKNVLVPTVGEIVPQSVAAAGSATSGWISAATAPEFVVKGLCGALGGGSVAISLEQATSSGGAGSKSLKAVGTSAVDDTTVEGDLEVGELDVAGGFTHFRAKAAVTGGTGALLSVVVMSGVPRYA